MTALLYRGRLAPTPTGYLHLGHARTFWIAYQRSLATGGALILRNEDLDASRCQSVYATAMLEDLRWFGLSWSEGPDVGGPHAPYCQSERRDWYLRCWKTLHAAGSIYPCSLSRKDVQAALQAPHGEEAEPIYPPQLRTPIETGRQVTEPGSSNWRFRVPDGHTIRFADGRHGLVERTAGVDFGDFLVWRKDGFPAYELAVVADDHAMQITEVVRGDDLLTSTARQLLLYEALGWTPPEFYHCKLMLDQMGVRLAKRSAALSLRELRAASHTPEELRASWNQSDPKPGATT
ncbi:MAG: glutamate--tRNA ligase family protein [Planctomycetota bacterium]|nr:glutamate--tRNA ligase family protein [Planctomycetota bacterium]